MTALLVVLAALWGATAGTLVPRAAYRFSVPPEEPWRDRLAGVLRTGDPVDTPAGYYGALAGLGCAVDAWETTYAQLLTGEDPVLDWVKGSALRPVLTRLADDPGAAERFTAQYRDRLREAFPAGPHGTVYPFRRIFAVAAKP